VGRGALASSEFHDGGFKGEVHLQGAWMAHTPMLSVCVHPPKQQHQDDDETESQSEDEVIAEVLAPDTDAPFATGKGNAPAMSPARQRWIAAFKALKEIKRHDFGASYPDLLPPPLTYCKNCGKVFCPDSNFCRRCGSKFPSLDDFVDVDWAASVVASAPAAAPPTAKTLQEAKVADEGEEHKLAEKAVESVVVDWSADEMMPPGGVHLQLDDDILHIAVTAQKLLCGRPLRKGTSTCIQLDSWPSGPRQRCAACQKHWRLWGMEDTTEQHRGATTKEVARMKPRMLRLERPRGSRAGPRKSLVASQSSTRKRRNFKTEQVLGTASRRSSIRGVISREEPHNPNQGELMSILGSQPLCMLTVQEDSTEISEADASLTRSSPRPSNRRANARPVKSGKA